MMYMIALEQGRMQGLPAPEEFAKNLFQELDTDKNGNTYIPSTSFKSFYAYVFDDYSLHKFNFIHLYHCLQ